MGKKSYIFKFIVFYLLLLSQFSNTCLAQTKQIDSLKILISKAKNDSTKVDNINLLSKNYFSIDPEISLQYSNNAKEISSKINYTKGLALAYKNIGIAYYMQSKNSEAIQNWNYALIQYKNYGDKVGQANMLSNIGVIYLNVTDDTKALDYFLNALKIAEQLNDSLRIATVLMNIGSIYAHKKATYNNAIDYLHRSLPICEALNDQAALGTVFVNLGEIYYELEKLDSSLYYLQKSLIVYKGSENIPYSYIYLGKV